jgi:hypothetical protein
VDSALGRRGNFFRYLVASLCWQERAERLLSPGDPEYLLGLEDARDLGREGERTAAANAVPSAKASSGKKSRKKGGITPAGRRKLSQMMKARWAARRKG